MGLFEIEDHIKRFKTMGAKKYAYEDDEGKLHITIAGVNKNLTYLICNDKNSTTGKSADAKKLGIPVITEEEYLNLKS